MGNPKNNVDYYINKVVSMAADNAKAGKGGPFAALVVRDGEVVASGTNVVTSTNDPTAHAEVVAIRNACEALGDFQLADCDLYTSCEPCPMCLGAIYWARPSRVYYAATRHDAAAGGFDDAFIYREIGIDPGRRKIPMIHVENTRATEVFEAWNELPGKTRY